MLAYLSALARCRSWKQTCSSPYKVMKIWRWWPLGMAEGRSIRYREQGSREFTGRIEFTALNMKGKEHFYVQGHFSKWGTSACSGLKQVNTKIQLDESLLEKLAEHGSVHWDCLLWVHFLRGRTPLCCHYTNAMHIDFKAWKRSRVIRWISMQSVMGKITLPLWTWSLSSFTRGNFQM